MAIADPQIMIDESQCTGLQLLSNTIIHTANGIHQTNPNSKGCLQTINLMLLYHTIALNTFKTLRTVTVSLLVSCQDDGLGLPFKNSETPCAYYAE
jgi:hypothetical protein